MDARLDARRVGSWSLPCNEVLKTWYSVICWVAASARFYQAPAVVEQRNARSWRLLCKPPCNWFKWENPRTAWHGAFGRTNAVWCDTSSFIRTNEQHLSECENSDTVRLDAVNSCKHHELYTNNYDQWSCSHKLFSHYMLGEHFVAALGTRYLRKLFSSAMQCLKNLVKMDKRTSWKQCKTAIPNELAKRIQIELGRREKHAATAI